MKQNHLGMLNHYFTFTIQNPYQNIKILPTFYPTFTVSSRQDAQTDKEKENILEKKTGDKESNLSQGFGAFRESYQTLVFFWFSITIFLF
jgi:hypothetical protein